MRKKKINGVIEFPKKLKLAVKVQENFLPKRNLKNYPVHGVNIAAREVSGDFLVLSTQ